MARIGAATTSVEHENDALLPTLAHAGLGPGLLDDGDRIFFEIPSALKLGVGTHRVKLVVKGDLSQADMTVAVWPRGTQLVVSDIDGTITTAETDGVWTVFDPSAPTPHPSALETFAAYASKGYRVMFLTARPEFLSAGTRAWFESHGFNLFGYAGQRQGANAFGDYAGELDRARCLAPIVQP